MTIQAVAKRLAKKYGTANPQTILEAMHIKIFEIPMTGIRGMYKKIKRNVVVFVDSELSEEDRTFVLAHELGHHMLHRGDNRVFLDSCTLFRVGRYESEANLFAVSLLAEGIDDISENDLTVDIFAARLGISRHLAETYFRQ